MKKIKESPFKFELEVEAVPYRPDTVEYLFGKGASFMDYPAHIMASEFLGELIKDAIGEVLHSKTLLIMRTKTDDPAEMNERDRMFWEYLCDKEERYNKIAKTTRPVLGD